LLGEVHAYIGHQVQDFEGYGGGIVGHRSQLEGNVVQGERMGVCVRPDVLAWTKEKEEGKPD
jgi:hypothetical protein